MSTVLTKRMVEMLIMPLHTIWGEDLLSYQPALQLINQYSHGYYVVH
jgi:hypothetical protein